MPVSRLSLTRVGAGPALITLLAAGLLACAEPDAPPDALPADPALAPPDSAGPLQATSLLGRPLYAMDLSEENSNLVRDLDSARTRYAADPSAANLIWLGRRHGYLWRYRTAVDLFSRGIETFPDDPRFYRHRGHRYISLREFDRASADLQRAADLIAGHPDEVEPDGAPNPSGLPRSTLHFNVWYHLGLAHYLQGRFEEALDAYRSCLEVSDNDDALVATSDWLYMTLRRLGRDVEARAVLDPIRAEMEILENTSYHRRLLMYKGEIPPDSLLDTDAAAPLDVATQGYGVGNWYLYNGDEQRAREIFEQVVAGAYWPAFGFIAAEAELARMTPAQR